MPTQSDYILSRMKLLPRDTVRITGSVRDHKVLHVRVRKDDYPVLQTVASEEWLQYMHEDVTVLVSTTNTHDHLSVEMYEDMVLTLPLSKTKAKMLKTKNKELRLRIKAVKMLAGKGSSMARRAIVTLEVQK